MIRIKQFVFNPFMVNSYLLSDETGECVLIDAACNEPREQEEFRAFIADHGLKLVRNLNTHCHIDHIPGNQFIADTYGVYPEYHKASLPLLVDAGEIGAQFGFNIRELPEPRRHLDDGEIVTWGSSSLKVLYTPGHADGSVCFYNEQQGFVITGDVLFRDTIGRSDLPTGDFDLLMNSIRSKLFTLPPDTVVYPGHGPETSIGYEMINNPFIR